MFERNCPTCQKILNYKLKKNYVRAVKNNRGCCSCDFRSRETRTLEKYSQYYCKDTALWIKRCPECYCEMKYNTIKLIRRAVKQNYSCRSCSMSRICGTPEFRDNQKNNINNMRLDPNSKINSKEARDKKIISLKLYASKPDSHYKSNDWIEGQINLLSKSNRTSSKGERELANLLQIYDFELCNLKHRVGNYCPDIIHKNKPIIIEYYGDYYHCNPNKYADDFVFRYSENTTITAKDIRHKDAERISYLQSKGYVVYVVWESDFKTKKESILRDIVDITETYKT